MNRPTRNRPTRIIKNKKINRGYKIFLWILLILAVVVAGFIALTYKKVDDFLDEITTISEPTIEGEEPIDPKYTEEPFALVILGLDTRSKADGLNTDVMIVAVIEPKDKNISLLSIPRDTAVAMPGYSGYEKINAAYARGENARIKAEKKNEPIKVTGTSLVKKTLEGLLGIPVKHHMIVDFVGFQKVIDELGGIEVDVERSLLYHDPKDGTNIDLKKGLQKLNGKQALDYVRHRMDNRGQKYYSSDFDRNYRQQLIIGLLADKMKSFTGVVNIFPIMEAVGDHIRTDLSKEKIKGLAMDFSTIGSEKIEKMESGAVWNSKILKTVFPDDTLEVIRLALWSKMGMTEKEGRARLIPENDKVVSTLTTQINNAKKENASKIETSAPAQKDQQPVEIQSTEADTIQVHEEQETLTVEEIP